MSLIGRLARLVGKISAYVTTIEVVERDGETRIAHRWRTPREIAEMVVPGIGPGDDND